MSRDRSMFDRIFDPADGPWACECDVDAPATIEGWSWCESIGEPIFLAEHVEAWRCEGPHHALILGAEVTS